ncbi:MAG: hypothetical protein J3K34DRAFT_515754 [Monoraphidium minutum]|nr:MAG: hypothetical protein J3K34DRAFT_515754 [Monoraphidium minutum]
MTCSMRLRLQLVAALVAAAALASSGTSAKEIGCRSKWGPYIEGAAVDKEGNLYAVDFQRDRGLIGRVTPAGACGDVPAAASAGGGAVKLNGLRVLPGGAILGVSPESKRVVVLPPPGGGGAPRDFCGDPKMVAPNDLAVSAKTGFVYVSAQRWKSDNVVGDGAVYLCRKAGDAPVRLAELGRTNGIDVSPDGAWLFVSESFNKGFTPTSNVIWRYPIRADGGLDAAGRKLVADFGKLDNTAKVDVDGMRLDTAGRLYVTRHLGSEVVALEAMGTNKVAARLKMPFWAPTNLELGGPKGTTLFVVGRCGRTPHGQGDGCVEAVEVGAPGAWWSALQQGLPRVRL